MNKLYTTSGVGRELGVTTERVRQMVMEGQLAATETALGWRTYDPADVEALAAKRAAQGFTRSRPSRGRRS